jgi:hypothetical protein
LLGPTLRTLHPGFRTSVFGYWRANIVCDDFEVISINESLATRRLRAQHAILPTRGHARQRRRSKTRQVPNRKRDRGRRRLARKCRHAPVPVQPRDLARDSNWPILSRARSRPRLRAPPAGGLPAPLLTSTSRQDTSWQDTSRQAQALLGNASTNNKTGKNRILTVAAKHFSASTSRQTLHSTHFSAKSLGKISRQNLSANTSRQTLLGKHFSANTSVDALLGKHFSANTSVDALHGKNLSANTSLEVLHSRYFTRGTSLEALHSRHSRACVIFSNGKR